MKDSIIKYKLPIAATFTQILLEL